MSYDRDPNKGEDGEGTPTESVTRWPHYTLKNKEYFTLDTAPSTVRWGLRERQCTFWSDIIPQLEISSEHSECIYSASAQVHDHRVIVIDRQ